MPESSEAWANKLDAEDVQLLVDAQADKTRSVEILVSGCAYSCCGRGWMRRDGYEQTYRGWIDCLQLDEHPQGPRWGTFMLYSPGLGTISYVVAVRFGEVLGISWA